MTKQNKYFNKDISVIVCAYNGENSIYNCLMSLARQKGIDSSKYEVLLVDDGSQDRTGILVKSFLEEHDGNLPVFRYIKIQHRGLSVARNTGMLSAKSSLIAYIDVDAVADKYWIYELLKAWNKYPDAESIGGRVKILNYQNCLAQMLHNAFYDEPDKSAIIGTNMSFKRQRLLDIGGFCDLFVSRGDETYLFGKMGDRFCNTEKNSTFIKWTDAVVYHPRPEKILKWLRERIMNGKMIVIVNKVLGIKDNILIKHSFKRLSFVIILVTLLFFIFFELPELLVVILGIMLIKWKVSKIWNGIFNLYKNKYGFFKALCAGYIIAILEDLGNLMFSYGVVIKHKKCFLLNKSTYSNQCSITKDYVIEEIDTNTLRYG